MKVTNTVKNSSKLASTNLRSEEIDEFDFLKLATLRSSSTSDDFFFDFESLESMGNFENPLPDSVTTGASSDQPMILDVMSTPSIAIRPNVVA